MSSPVTGTTLPALKLSSPETREFWEIPVLFEDDHLLVINKPVGLAVAPEPEQTDRPNLIGLLHQGIAAAKPWATARRLEFLMYAHRLDSEASGVLLLAKSKPILTKLLDWFGSERATVGFVALAFGEPPEPRFTMEGKLAVHPAKPGLFHVNSKLGKRARTSVEVVEQFDGSALLRCVPYPNRPHQVRVHLARSGLKVMGDTAYGAKPLLLSRLKPGFRLKPGHTERPLLGRPCLHAERVETMHPALDKPLLVEATWPKDLQVALKYLRLYAPRR